jgi:hypothetical protein
MGKVVDAQTQALLAMDTTTFDVQQAPEQAVNGHISAQLSELYRGETQVCDATITNAGTQTWDGQAIRTLLVGLDDASSHDIHSDSYNLASGESESVTTSHNTGALELGTYACMLQARINDDWSTLDYDTFTLKVPPIVIDAQLQPGDRGRVLVLLDGPYVDDTGATIDTDPLGPPLAPDVTTQRHYLETLLTENGWSYSIVTDADSFTTELRSGGYTTYLMLSEQVKLSEPVQKELREAVYRGEGLVMTGSHDHRNHNVWDALGVKHLGKLSDATGMLIFDSDLSPEQELNLSYGDKVLRVELLDALSVSDYFNTVNGLNEPLTAYADAITLHSYGDGRDVFMGFDWLAHATLQGTQHAMAGLLLDALNYVHPDSINTQVGSVIPVTLTLTNEGIATPGRATIALSPQTTLVDAGEGIAVDDQHLYWDFDLAEDAIQPFTFWIRLPETVTPAMVDALIAVGVAPDLIDYTQASFSLTPQPAPVLADALADLEPLANDKSADKAYRRAYSLLEKADDALQNDEPANALRDLVRATDELAAIDEPAAKALRRHLDQVIRHIGRAW